jgi:hypothetical protein
MSPGPGGKGGETGTRPTRDDGLTRFFGGSPLGVLFRLALLSILVGVILEVLGLDPWNIIDSLRVLYQRVWDMGFEAVRWLARYLALGAAIGYVGRAMANINPIIVNNTFYKNTSEPEQEGATIFAEKVSPEIRKNIIVIEGDQKAAGGIQSSPLYQCNLLFDPTGVGLSSLPSTETLVGDPLFCDPEHEDFYLRDLSPAWLSTCGPIGALGKRCTSFKMVPEHGARMVRTLPCREDSASSMPLRTRVRSSSSLTLRFSSSKAAFREAISKRCRESAACVSTDSARAASSSTERRSVSIFGFDASIQLVRPSSKLRCWRAAISREFCTWRSLNSTCDAIAVRRCCSRPTSCSSA